MSFIVNNNIMVIMGNKNTLVTLIITMKWYTFDTPSPSFQKSGEANTVMA